MTNRTKWWTTSFLCTLPTFLMSLPFSSTAQLIEVTLTTYFCWSSKIIVNTFKIVVSLDKCQIKRCSSFKYLWIIVSLVWIWSSACNLVVIYRIQGWWSIMLSTWRDGPLWHVMFTTWFTINSWLLLLTTCNHNL